MQTLTLPIRKFPAPAIYFVLADFGKCGTSWQERDQDHTGRETTIRDIISGEIDAPLKVIEADLDGGSSRDVTIEIAKEVAQRVAGEKVRHDLKNWLHDYAGIRHCNALEVA